MESHQSQPSEGPWVLVHSNGSWSDCEQITDTATATSEAEPEPEPGTQISTEGGESHTLPDDRIYTARAVDSSAGEKKIPPYAYIGSGDSIPYPETVGSDFMTFHEPPFDEVCSAYPGIFGSSKVDVYASRRTSRTDGSEWGIYFLHEPLEIRPDGRKKHAFSSRGEATARTIHPDVGAGAGEQSDRPTPSDCTYVCYVQGTGFTAPEDVKSRFLPGEWRSALKEGDKIRFEMDPDLVIDSASGATGAHHVQKTLEQKMRFDADKRLDYPFVTARYESHKGHASTYDRWFNDPPINVSTIPGTFYLPTVDGPDLWRKGGLQVTTEITATQTRGIGPGWHHFYSNVNGRSLADGPGGNPER